MKKTPPLQSFKSRLDQALEETYCRELRHTSMAVKSFSLTSRIVHDKISVLVKVYLSVIITIFRTWILVPISLQEERCPPYIQTEALQLQREVQRGATLFSEDELGTKTFEQIRIETLGKVFPSMIGR